MSNFFYDINKRMAELDKSKEQLSESAVNERSTGDYSAKKARAGKDIGKPGKQFAKIAKSAGERYGSKERGEKVAGAVLAKLRKGVAEDEMEEGNEFSGARAAAIKAGKSSFKVDGKTYPVTNEERDRDEAEDDDWWGDKDKNKDKKSRPADTRQVAGRSYGGSAQDDRDDDEEEAPRKKKSDDDHEEQTPRRRGRPKGSKSSRGAHGVSTRSKLAYKQDDDEPSMPKRRGRPKGSKNKVREDEMMSRADRDPSEYDREGEMAHQQLRTASDAAEELRSILDSDENLPEWVQKKINLAVDYLDTARDYMKSNDEEPVTEKAVSKAQRRAAGIAHAAQKGDYPKSNLRGASKAMAKMPAGELSKFAKTKEKGLPTHKKKDVEETTTSGSVAASTAAPKAGKSKGGMQFGKGIYDSMNRELERMISESMTINASMSDSPHSGMPSRTLTVTATDEDADRLADVLNLAGLSGGNAGSQACPTCNTNPCCCAEIVDENAPDWPTDEVMSDDALQYSGGLNKPKHDVAGDGQTVMPTTAVRVQESGSMLKRYIDIINAGSNKE